MKKEDVYVGLRYQNFDHKAPKRYQIFEVVELGEDTFKAINYATKAVGEYPYSIKVERIGDEPIALNDLRPLIGRKFKVRLNTGSTFTVRLTAIEDWVVKINGKEYTFPKELEFDRDNYATYSVSVIEEMTLLQ